MLNLIQLLHRRIIISQEEEEEGNAIEMNLPPLLHYQR